MKKNKRHRVFWKIWSTFRYCFPMADDLLDLQRLESGRLSPTFETKSKPSSHTCSEFGCWFRNFEAWQSEDPLLERPIMSSVHIAYRQVQRLKPGMCMLKLKQALGDFRPVAIAAWVIPFGRDFDIWRQYEIKPMGWRFSTVYSKYDVIRVGIWCY